jgi:hypothetical protein
MIRPAIIALCAAPAFAGNVADFGGTGCKLVPVTGQAHVAEVQCHNVHTTGPAFDVGIMSANGIEVQVSIDHGPGDEPDTLMVLPYDGYYAEPSVMVIREWDGETALIFEWVGS